MQHEAVVRMLKSAGMRATRQRVAIARLIATAQAPLSIAGMASRLPSLDTVTVYRTIDAFKKAGIVREVDLRERGAHYELADAHDHHHIVCTECGAIETFIDCAHERVQRRILRTSRMFSAITSHSFELFGLCRKCAPVAIC